MANWTSIFSWFYRQFSKLTNGHTLATDSVQTHPLKKDTDQQYTFETDSSDEAERQDVGLSKTVDKTKSMDAGPDSVKKRSQDGLNIGCNFRSPDSDVGLRKAADKTKAMDAGQDSVQMWSYKVLYMGRKIRSHEKVPRSASDTEETSVNRSPYYIFLPA
ncbi:hypothetical protein CHS0354_002649 [Potamilus streckersoni]|uniref:Uncharacterized protein n=1 Tax=Potamilus streckersoni TaxID=2493646 RepID=A0AAE0VX11_9BIVA|nr:hypothetical protein CHS0354_002649 [Potamilus streckersoni]